jgi:predicted DNA-binding transcriptional regulator
MVNYKERIFDNESIINFMKKQIQSSIILNIREKIEKAVRKIEKMIKNE